MSLVESNMMALGTIAPNFTLLDTVSGKEISLETIASDTGTVVMFICNHCPYVKHIQMQLVNIANMYQPKGIGFIAISANDAKNYPQDAPDMMTIEAKQNNYPFPYCYDESQEVAKAYSASCTPDIFVFDKAMKCVYRGRFDSATPGNNEPVTGKDLTTALDALLTGAPISAEQHPSMGCSIKWKA